MESDRCARCGGPIGQGVARCPLCGADLFAPPTGTGAPQFQPAIVGMKEPRTISSRRQPQSGAGRKNLILALVGAAGLLLLSGLGYAAFRMIAVPEPQATAHPAPPASGPVPLTLEGVAVPDPKRADPTDLLPAARKRVTEGGQDFSLLEISVFKAKGGFVDLTEAGGQIGYRYLYEQSDPRIAKKDLKRERVELTLRGNNPALDRSKPIAGDQSVPDPLCVWSAAWRAVIATGLSADSYFEAHYGRSAKSDKPVWTFTSSEKPDKPIEVDGQSCVIRAGR